MQFSLWPLRQRYITFVAYVVALEKLLIKEFDLLETDHIGKGNVTGAFSDADILTWSPWFLANKSHELLRNLSNDRFDTRFDPYNAQLVKLYNEESANLTVVSRELRKQSTWLGPIVSNIETAFAQYNLYKELAKKTLADFVSAITKMEKTKQPLGDVENTGDPFDTYFTDTLIEISNAYNKDGSDYDKAPGSQACHALAAPIGTCKGIKPESSRACQICKNRQNRGIDWIPGTEWKEKILEMIESIHKRVCPYISDEFATSPPQLGMVFLHQLMDHECIKADHNYQLNVYNSTYWTLGAAVDENSLPVTPAPYTTSQGAILGSNHRDANRPTFITFRREFPNNKSEAHYDVDDLLMQEKADYEFSFNWAIDMNWRIFSTVLGYCMPHYETKIPLISAQFYALYSKHFLHPLRQIWMSNRDNSVLKTVLGSFYGTGKGERWGKICMESSFLASSDRSFRPPRYLYVNAFTEMNYFTTGPLSGTGGRLLEAVI
ncbi:hypothetical protein Ocin01_05959 [Orchesella cincta]|uniref:Uncharacterized protein n=1 Tax=Orchesella cincta TaxID=48709 RepID=A0A1D2N638_ORCCI|nr:hypothetical protein Ocin01_05959 [Orchesella cincta]